MPSVTATPKSLVQAFQLLDASFSGATAGVASFTPDGTLHSANNAALVWLGWAREEALGKLTLAGIAPSIELEHALRGGLSTPAQVEFVRRDGHRAQVLASTVPISDADGTHVLTRLWLHDIPADADAETKLRLNEADMARAQALTHFGHYEADLFHDAVSEGLRWSDEFFRILGLDPSRGPFSTSEFIERCVYPDDRERFLSFADDCIARSQGGTLEYRIVRPDGEIRHVRDVVQFLPSGSGRPARFFGVVQDITELTDAQERLRHLTQHLLDVRESERENLARELHDELGSMLTAVKMYVADAAENVAQQGSKLEFPLAKALELLNLALSSSRRITSNLRPSVLDHRGLLGALEWLADSLARSAGIACNIDIEQTVIEQLENSTIRTGLFRIVQEAMRNAVRHANATRITVRARRGEGHLRVEIEDDGKGVSSTELRKPESIGVLGMQERTRALGGQFVLNSEPGTGTKVTVRLPLVSRAKSEVMRSL